MESPDTWGKGRTIPAIIGHIHNVRLMWLRNVGDATGLPDELEEASFSKKDAIKALAASSRAAQEFVARSLAGDGRIKGFKPDACSFMGYLFAHDGHQRTDCHDGPAGWSSFIEIGGFRYVGMGHSIKRISCRALRFTCRASEGFVGYIKKDARPPNRRIGCQPNPG
jgi:hypothetical protein